MDGGLEEKQATMVCQTDKKRTKIRHTIYYFSDQKKIIMHVFIFVAPNEHLGTTCKVLTEEVLLCLHSAHALLCKINACLNWIWKPAMHDNRPVQIM